MGIKNLNNLISEFTNIDPKNKKHLTGFKNKTFAIDANLYIYKFLYSNGNYINGLFFMINKLKKFNINPIFIFDGKAPKEKTNTIKNRKNLKKKLRTQVLSLKADLILIDDVEKKNTLEKKIHNLQKRLVYVDRDVIIGSKKLLDLMKVVHITSDTEAEHLCSVLSKLGIVDGVISDDTDTLACGSLNILRNFSNKNDYISFYNMDEILYELGLTYNSFLDLCILLGTDYNSKLKTLNYKNIYKLIKKYNSIEEIINNTSYNITYNYSRIRAIFKSSCINDNIINKIIDSKKPQKDNEHFDELLIYLKQKSSINKSSLIFRLDKMYKRQTQKLYISNKYSFFDSPYKVNLNYINN